MGMPTQQVVKQSVDVVAYSGVVAAFAGWLPPLAAGASFLWISIQIFEKISGEPFHATLRRWLRLTR